MGSKIRPPILLIAAAVLIASAGCADTAEQLRTSVVSEAHLRADTSEWPATFGIGRPVSPDEIAAWDIDVGPDGTGLPPGSGSVEVGERLYVQQCAACHGATGTEGPEVRLVGRLLDDAFPFGDELGHAKTIGNYWPYAPTVFDYIRRAMPYGRPGSLSDDDVYSLTAFLLHKNGLIPRDAVMDAASLPLVEMPARNRFVADDRVHHDVVR